MKNAIIIVLAAAVAFFAALNAGFLRSEAKMNDSRAAYREARVNAVKRQDVWRLGMVDGDGTDAILRYAVAGARAAVSAVNRNGGAAGRLLELDVRPTRPATRQNVMLAMQDLCSDLSVAVLLGPIYSANIPSVSAITQFQALPLLSPLTINNPQWTPPDPDNYYSVYMPIRYMAGVIMADLFKKRYRNILVVNPSDAADTVAFTQELGRQFHSRFPDGRLFLAGYDVPLNPALLQNLLSLYLLGHQIDAVVFTSTVDELQVCCSILDGLGVRKPIYGSDNLDIPGIDTKLARIGFEVSYARCRIEEPIPGFDEAYLKLAGFHPNIWAYYGALAVRTVCQALEDANGNYDPDDFAVRARQFAVDFWDGHKSAVSLRNYTEEN